MLSIINIIYKTSIVIRITSIRISQGVYSNNIFSQHNIPISTCKIIVFELIKLRLFLFKNMYYIYVYIHTYIKIYIYEHPKYPEDTPGILKNM